MVMLYHLLNMDNEEPQLSQISNLQISDEGHKLPEQSKVPNCTIPRPFDAMDLIHQWQPMGIRVVVNVPFTGNDENFLFAIRNGPFIPRLNYVYNDSTAKHSAGGQPQPTVMQQYCDYGYNNMRNVFIGSLIPETVDPEKFGVFVTHYDYPPPLSNYSTFFRKWRGTMHYRIRTIAGFTTQGYLFASMVRNVPSRPVVINRFKTTNPLPIEDVSYKSSMINSYVMGDTAMFRHFEVQVPFEYPEIYYDQYNWIANRTRPYDYFENYTKGDGTQTDVKAAIYNEPVGDNFIVVGLRGSLDTQKLNSQISFELEYRAGDDFQFSDPFLPFPAHFQTPRLKPDGTKEQYLGQTAPSNDYDSDGFGIPTSTTKTLISNIPPGSNRSYPTTNNRTANLRRNPREIMDDDNGYDTVDTPPPFRKSLRSLLAPE